VGGWGLDERDQKRLELYRKSKARAERDARKQKKVEKEEREMQLKVVKGEKSHT
jgi:hypothetical protein